MISSAAFRSVYALTHSSPHGLDENSVGTTIFLSHFIWNLFYLFPHLLGECFLNGKKWFLYEISTNLPFLGFMQFKETFNKLNLVILNGFFPISEYLYNVYDILVIQ